MKTLIVVAAALGLVAVGALAQGQFTFGNKNLLASPVIDAKVLSEKGVPVAGAEYWAIAYVKLATESESAYAPIAASAVNFRTDANAGYIRSAVVTAPFAAGTAVTVQMRAWEAAGGTSYEAAVASGKPFGKSIDVPLTLSGPPNTPPDMIGLQTFSLVPEPSTFALGLLGAAALLLRRRS